MSARDYKACPQCRERRIVEIDQHAKQLEDSYGTASRSEYEKIKSEKPPKLEDETLGEYYEWEFTSKGKFWYRFNFVCEECGFKFQHKGEVDYPIDRTIDDD